MRKAHLGVAIVGVVATGCLGHYPDRETDFSDPEVQTFLAIAAKTDWERLGFSPLPASGSVRMYKKGRFSSGPSDANDVGLLAEGGDWSRDWYFDRVGDSYELVCAGETFKGPRTWQRPNLKNGQPYREFVDLHYVARQSGACGAGNEIGLRGVYWGPQGITKVNSDEIIRIRAEFRNVISSGSSK